MYPHRIGLFACTALWACVAACGEPSDPRRGCAAVCPTGLVCDEASGTCVPPSGSPPGCAEDADCPEALPRCDTGRKSCVECLDGSGCPSGACAHGVCLPVPEKCDVAQPIELGEAVTVIEATTSGRVNDTTASCALGDPAPDLVYELIVHAPSRIHASARARGQSTVRPVLELRSACGPVENAEILGCRYADSPEAGAQLSVDVPAGRYYLWVDADFGTSGDFTLELFATPARSGESCAAPHRILPTLDTITVTGDTRPLADEYHGYCGGAGPDEVFEVVLTRARRLQVSVEPTSAGFSPVVYLRRPDACASNEGAAQLDCGVAQGDGTASLDVPRLEAGTYSLIVDGALGPDLQPTAGAYELTINQLPPLVLSNNDRCDGATPITLPATGTLQVEGDTFTALSDTTSACGGTGGDVVYSFELTEPRYVLIHVAPEDSPSFAPVLHLRTSCDSDAPADLVACSAATQFGGAARTIQGSLPAGTYFLWVDGLLQSRGRFVVTFEVNAPLKPPANDACTAPETIEPMVGTVSFGGTTIGAADDASGCETPAGAPSPDVVYRLEVPVDSSLSLDVQANQGSTLRPVLYLEHAVTCGAPVGTHRLFCTASDPSSPNRAVRTLGSVPAGTYYLWVDGDLTSSGSFTGKVTLGPPVPQPLNEDCKAVLPLTWGSVVIGDTRGADDSTWGACQPYPGGSGEGAGDVAYRFIVNTSRTVQITVTPDPVDGKLFRPVVYVRGPDVAACGAAGAAKQLGCGVAPALGGTATLTLPNVAPGTWTVWVDGAGQTTGRFTLSIQ